jgi:hypothetical protein
MTPSGLTEEIYEGKPDWTIEDFARRCASQFGPMIRFKDVPHPEIPARLDPQPYHRDQLEKAQRELAQTESWTGIEAQQQAMTANRNMRASDEAAQRGDAELRARYEKMQAEVEAWEVPASLDALKAFMLSALRDSMAFDLPRRPRPPTIPFTPEAYRATKLAALRRDVEYHTEMWNKEVERTNEQNEWLRDFHEATRAFDRAGR